MRLRLGLTDRDDGGYSRAFENLARLLDLITPRLLARMRAMAAPLLRTQDKLDAGPLSLHLLRDVVARDFRAQVVVK